MRYPLSLGAARKDSKNGGEYRPLYDSDGAWLGDLRYEHAETIVHLVNRSLSAASSEGEKK